MNTSNVIVFAFKITTFDGKVFQCPSSLWNCVKNEVQNILKRYVYIHKNVISIYHYLSVK